MEMKIKQNGKRHKRRPSNPPPPDLPLEGLDVGVEAEQVVDLWNLHFHRIADVLHCASSFTPSFLDLGKSSRPSDAMESSLKRLNLV